MAVEEWDSSDDEAPEEQDVAISKKSQLEQQKTQKKLANDQRAKERSQRREIQQRRELDKLERQQKKLLEESENEEIPDELPMDILENFEEIKPTKVVFSEEDQELKPVPSLIDLKRSRVSKLREMRAVTNKKVDGGINVQKVTKQSIKSRKLDTGLNNFKSNWLNRESIRRS